MAVQDRGITFLDLTWIIQNDNMSYEALSLARWIINLVAIDNTSLDVLAVNADVEIDNVTWNSLRNIYMVHLDRPNLSCLA
jgi:hypothetical protein